MTMPHGLRSLALTLVGTLAAASLAAQAAPQVPTELSLLGAVSLGRQQAVTATLANLNARVAGERVGIKRAELLPQIAGNAGITPQTVNFEQFGLPGVIGVTPPFTLYSVQVTGSQMIFDAAAIERLKAASDSATVAGLDAQFAGSLAGTAAGLAYLRVLAATELVTARVADSAIAATLLAQARQFQAAGVTPAIDLTRNEVNARAVQADLLNARNELARARLDLLRLLNLPLSATLRLTDSLGAAPVDVPLVPDSAVSFALGHRTDVTAEAGRTEVARKNLRAINNEYLPSLGVQGQYNWAGQQSDRLLGSYSLMFGLHIPVFDGMRRQRRSSEQSLRLEAQQLREYDVKRQAEQEVRRVPARPGHRGKRRRDRHRPGRTRHAGVAAGPRTLRGRRRGQRGDHAGAGRRGGGPERAHPGPRELRRGPHHVVPVPRRPRPAPVTRPHSSPTRA